MDAQSDKVLEVVRRRIEMHQERISQLKDRMNRMRAKQEFTGWRGTKESLGAEEQFLQEVELVGRDLGYTPDQLAGRDAG